MITIKVWPWFVVLTLISACSQTPASQQSCKKWAQINRGEYVLTNNVWGAGGQANYRQCIALSDEGGNAVYGWQWQWPGKNNGQVIAYPSILYGHKPWHEQTTAKALPIAISNIDSLLVSYKVQQKGVGSHNLLLESWITSTAIPRPQTRTAEIAIHLMQQNWPGMPGKLIGTVHIDGGSYGFYLEPEISVPGDKHRWAYLGFVSKTPFKEQGQVDMGAFVSFLLEQGYIEKSHYLSSVELGSELVQGSGETLVKAFNVQL